MRVCIIIDVYLRCIYILKNIRTYIIFSFTRLTTTRILYCIMNICIVYMWAVCNTLCIRSKSITRVNSIMMGSTACARARAVDRMRNNSFFFNENFSKNVEKNENNNFLNQDVRQNIYWSKKMNEWMRMYVYNAVLSRAIALRAHHISVVHKI